MAFMNLSEISGSGRRNRKVHTESHDLNIYLCVKNKATGERGITFVMSRKLAKEYRLQEGDRMFVLYDPETLTGLLQRVPSNAKGRGHAVSGLKDDSKSNPRVQLTFREEMGIYPSAEGISPENVTLTDKGIQFTVPAEATKPGNLATQVIIETGEGEMVEGGAA